MPYISPADIAPPDISNGPSEVPTVAELRALFGNFPDGLGAFDQMYQRMIGNGRLERSLRFVVLGAAARWRNDPFVASVMFGYAIDDGFDPAALAGLIEEAEQGEPVSGEGHLLAFCRKSTETAFKMVQSDVDGLLETGWTNGQIVEAVTMVGLSGYMTVMAASGGLLTTPGLEAEPWH